jgi:hypothetical protein
MKGLAAVGFFFAEAILLAVGVARAANGQGIAVLVIGSLVTVALFVKFGCLDNAPSDH